MSKNQKKGKIIKTLTSKRKVKCHYMKQDDRISTSEKQQNSSSFLFSLNKFLSFIVSKMSTKDSFVEKLQKQSREKSLKLKNKNKREKEEHMFSNMLPL